ncbi:GTPase [Citromicrobium bathyomarinum]
MSDWFDQITSPEFLAGLGFLLTVFVGLAALMSTLTRLFRGLTLSYRVALIGRPRAGKTSLLAAMFDQILSGNTQKNVKIVGTKTIRQIGDIIYTLDTSGTVEPTLSEDRFLFRFFYYPLRYFRDFFKYEVEITDFPGEYSDDLFAISDDESISQDEQFLIDQEYLSWATHCHTIILAIDTEEWIRRGNRYAETISHKMRSTILALSEYRSEAHISSAPFKIALVFTKFDLILSDDYGYDGINSEPMMQKIYLSTELDESITEFTSEANKSFSTLIDFLQNSPHTSRIFFTSALKSSDRRERFGVGKLLQFCLPRKGIGR